MCRKIIRGNNNSKTLATTSYSKRRGRSSGNGLALLLLVSVVRWARSDEADVGIGDNIINSIDVDHFGSSSNELNNYYESQLAQAKLEHTTLTYVPTTAPHLTTTTVSVAPTYSSPPQSSTPPSPPGPTLRVLNLNTWGLNWPWSVDRRQRYKALAEIIALSDYDLVLLQEVWFRSDYQILKKAVPYVAEFESYNLWCKWLYFPLHCSGLTILSRHPIADQDFMPFSRLGSFWNFDGEIFTNKGVARARIFWEGLSVDVFTTHMVSYSKNPNSDNSQYRYLQSKETLNYVASSDADVKILGGDLNSLPHTGPAQPYGVLRSHLRDALTDRYPDASLDPFFATFGNRRNTYSGRYHEERIDYLLFYAKQGVVDMRVKEFSMPSFMARDTEGKLVSISDHSPLDVEFIIRSAADYPPLEVEEPEHYISSNHIDEDQVPRIQSSVIPEEAFKTNRTIHHYHPQQQQQYQYHGGWRQQHHNVRWRRPLAPRRKPFAPPPKRPNKKTRTRSGLLRHFSHGSPQIKLRPELMPKKKPSGVPMAEVRRYKISRSSLSPRNRF